jgi:cobalamin biosynthesis protein CobT
MLKISYYNKRLKKNVFKSTTIKKWGGDQDKAQEFLNDWKKEQQDKMNNEPEPEKEDNEEPNNNNNNNNNEDEENDDVSAVDHIHLNKTKFNLDVPPVDEDACSNVIYGSSKSGKTTQILEILKKYYNDKKYIIIFMSSNIHKPIYKKLDKSVIKLDRWDDQFIKDVHKIQKKTNNKYRFVFASDDIVDNKNSEQLKKLILTYRNAMMSSIVCLQDTKILSRGNRNNVNNFIFRKYNSGEGQEDAVKFFVGSFKPFHGLRLEDQKLLYKKATAIIPDKEYNFIYINALEDTISFHN